MYSKEAGRLSLPMIGSILSKISELVNCYRLIIAGISKFLKLSLSITSKGKIKMINRNKDP